MRKSMNKAVPNRQAEESTRESWALKTNVSNSILINKRIFCLPDLSFSTRIREIEPS